MVATRQHPDQADTFDALRRRQLGRLNDDGRRNAGIVLGAASADAILAARENDGWDTEADYQWHPMGPGVYAEFELHSGTPKGFVFGAGWAEARPFALKSQGQFSVPPPPAMESADYVRAFNEVADVGRYQTLSRSPEQTHIALWWKDFAGVYLGIHFRYDSTAGTELGRQIGRYVVGRHLTRVTPEAGNPRPPARP